MEIKTCRDCSNIIEHNTTHNGQCNDCLYGSKKTKFSEAVYELVYKVGGVSIKINN